MCQPLLLRRQVEEEEEEEGTSWRCLTEGGPTWTETGPKTRRVKVPGVRVQTAELKQNRLSRNES